MNKVIERTRYDVDRIRRDFPILARLVNGRPLVYLDNGATAQKPQAMMDALNDYWQDTNANIHRGVHYLSQKATKQFDDTRVKVQTFLNAKHPEEVLFTKGCTESINLVATCLFSGASAAGTGVPNATAKLNPGDVILVSTMEHHSNIVPWQLLADRHGASVKPIPITDAGEIDLEAYETLLTQNPVRMVGIVHVSNSLGTVNPIQQMVEMAHRHGALVLVDGAQAGPHVPIDVQDLDADFYTLSCHKIYAPTGVGVLYGKRDLLEAMPPYQGGGDMIRTVSFERTTFAPLPAKFEAGTPDIAGVIGLGATIDYLASLAPGEETTLRARLRNSYAAFAQHEDALLEYATQRLLEVPGVRIYGTAPQKAGVLSFVLQGVHPHDIGTILDSEGLAVRTGHHCCMPVMTRYQIPATARASFALYNTTEEADALVAAVRKVKEMFGA